MLCLRNSKIKNKALFLERRDIERDNAVLLSISALEESAWAIKPLKVDLVINFGLHKLNQAVAWQTEPQQPFQTRTCNLSSDAKSPCQPIFHRCCSGGVFLGFAFLTNTTASYRYNDNPGTTYLKRSHYQNYVNWWHVHWLYFNPVVSVSFNWFIMSLLRHAAQVAGSNTPTTTAGWRIHTTCRSRTTSRASTRIVSTSSTTSGCPSSCLARPCSSTLPASSGTHSIKRYAAAQRACALFVFYDYIYEQGTGSMWSFFPE